MKAPRRGGSGFAGSAHRRKILHPLWIARGRELRRQWAFRQAALAWAEREWLTRGRRGAPWAAQACGQSSPSGGCANRRREEADPAGQWARRRPGWPVPPADRRKSGRSAIPGGCRFRILDRSPLLLPFHAISLSRCKFLLPPDDNPAEPGTIVPFERKICIH